jgi:methylated-DNA-protein-cysteine methyltransferase related protein
MARSHVARPASDIDDVSLARCRAILAVVAAIPAGEVRSYVEVARAAGWPRHARLVARVLASTEQDLPWHRVLRADGRIAFPMGSSAWHEQCDRLRSEGVALVQGRVRVGRAEAAARAAADGGLDAQIWGCN